MSRTVIGRSGSFLLFQATRQKILMLTFCCSPSMSSSVQKLFLTIWPDSAPETTTSWLSAESQRHKPVEAVQELTLSCEAPLDKRQKWKQQSLESVTSHTVESRHSFSPVNRVVSVNAVTANSRLIIVLKVLIVVWIKQRLKRRWGSDWVEVAGKLPEGFYNL